ncbi:NAD(P)H-dependent oxidoreductase [Candidatus Foliamicus sp.]
MKVLVVFAHPRENSFNTQIKDEFVMTVESLGHEVRVRDLYRQKFDPVASPEDLAAGGTSNYKEDVRTEQEHILWSDVITFIYPIWWISFPAILKGYVDRVLVDGFAYGHGLGKNHTAGLLEDKRGLLISTSGSTKSEFVASRKMEAITLSQDKYTLEFCNISVIDHIHFGPVGSRTTPDMANAYLEELRQKANAYFSQA